jgi:hypothetical protein
LLIETVFCFVIVYIQSKEGEPMKIKTLFLLTAFLFSCQSGEKKTQKNLKPQEIFNANAKLIPIIHSFYDRKYSGNGSSFIVTYLGKNYLISNYHVITAGQFGLEINNKYIEPEVLRVNDFEDIAIVTFPGIDKFKGIEIQPYEPGEGEVSYAIGYPGIAGRLGKPNLTITEGLVSNSKLLIDRGENGVKRYIQLSIPVNPGNSGGPVFNESGKLIGMTTLKWLNLSSVSAAIPTADIIREINLIPKTKTISDEEANISLKNRLDLMAISVNEMDILEFGFHYSPTVKLKIYPYAKSTAENVIKVFSDAKANFPNNDAGFDKYVSTKLSGIEQVFFFMMIRYMNTNKNESIDDIINSPFKITEIYLASRFYLTLMTLADLPYNEIDFTKYKLDSVKFNQDKTIANVSATIFLTKKSFPIKLDFVREWGIWFLVPGVSK